MNNNNINSTELGNGIRLIHEESNSPVAYLGIMINTGSRDELPNEQGMAHFMEHLAFKGTKKRRAYHIISRMEDVGGDINAYTTKEETAIFSTFLSQYYSRALELLKDIVIDSTFPEKEIEREKEVIIDEVNSYNDSPSELIYDDFEDLIFNGHSLGRNILGVPDEIKSYTRDNFITFRDRCYNTDNMVICSSGNIKFEDLKKLTEELFSDIKPNKREFSRVPFQENIGHYKKVDKETFQAHAIIGTTAYNIHSNNKLPLVLLNNILGGTSMSSRLNMALRERHGLAYSIESNYTPYSDTGILNIYFGTDHNNVDRATELIRKEINKLKNIKLGPLQLSKAKRQLQGQIALSKENREDGTLSMGRTLLLFNRVADSSSTYKNIEDISAEKLMDIANEIFADNKLSTLIYQ